MAANSAELDQNQESHNVRNIGRIFLMADTKKFMTNIINYISLFYWKQFLVLGNWTPNLVNFRETLLLRESVRKIYNTWEIFNSTPKLIGIHQKLKLLQQITFTKKPIANKKFRGRRCRKNLSRPLQRIFSLKTDKKWRLNWPFRIFGLSRFQH